jgi:carbon monoxide dehydrogenase subunit G
MQIDNAFEVPAAVEDVWALLLDVPRVVPCMPGAELVEQVDESTWKASMRVKLGPVSLNFATDVRQEEVDLAAHRLRLVADARETRGRGSARASIDSTVTPIGGGSSVRIVTELNLAGGVAQYGRGIIHDVSAQLVSSFAECLRAQLLEEAPVVGTKPVSGIRLLLRTLVARLRRPRSHART